MDKEPDYTFFQRRHRDDQLTYKKMLNITNHPGNANQSHISNQQV